MKEELWEKVWRVKLEEVGEGTGNEYNQNILKACRKFQIN